MEWTEVKPAKQNFGIYTGTQKSILTVVYVPFSQMCHFQSISLSVDKTAKLGWVEKYDNDKEERCRKAQRMFFITDYFIIMSQH